MSTVNMLEAKTNLSRLVESVETGKVDEVIIARNGRPVARLLPIADEGPVQRIGVARGAFKVPDSIGGDDDEIARLFVGRDA